MLAFAGHPASLCADEATWIAAAEAVFAQEAAPMDVSVLGLKRQYYDHGTTEVANLLALAGLPAPKRGRKLAAAAPISNGASASVVPCRSADLPAPRSPCVATVPVPADSVPANCGTALEGAVLEAPRRGRPRGRCRKGLGAALAVLAQDRWRRRGLRATAGARALRRLK